MVVNRASLTRFAWLSIGAAVLTICLKGLAYWLTGSVGLLSDALESLVNLAGAIMALMALTVAARPPDDTHAYGHDKIEYFSSGAEGALILVAACSIAYAAIERLLNPQPLEQVGIGLVVSVLASVVNLGVARVLLSAGRRYDSITLEADARHLMTDVWTSAGVVAGVEAVAATGIAWLDPVVALLVAANITRTGSGLIRRSVLGLMDTALPPEEYARLQAVLAGYSHDELVFHAVQTRQAASRRFVNMHVLVPGHWTVKQGHDMLERIEAEIRAALPGVLVTTHLEPIEDSLSRQDHTLERGDAPAEAGEPPG